MTDNDIPKVKSCSALSSFYAIQGGEEAPDIEEVAVVFVEKFNMEVKKDECSSLQSILMAVGDHMAVSSSIYISGFGKALKEEAARY